MDFTVKLFFYNLGKVEWGAQKNLVLSGHPIRYYIFPVKIKVSVIGVSNIFIFCISKMAKEMLLSFVLHPIIVKE